MNRCPFVRRSAAPFSTPAESAGSMPARKRVLRSSIAQSRLRDDHVHRNVMSKRADGVDPLRFEADADDQRLVLEGSKGSVEKSASITKSVAGCIEADKGRYDDIWDYFLALCRHWNVPYPAFKPLSRFP